MLLGNIPLRNPWPAEKKFFRTRLDVAGLAAEDGAVVLSPYTALSDKQKRIVAQNEAARVFMMQNQKLRPTFRLTKRQKESFAAYGPLQAVRETIAARILSGDPSALKPTSQQLLFVKKLKRAMATQS